MRLLSVVVAAAAAAAAAFVPAARLRAPATVARAKQRGLADRFVAPIIDDPGLPITDVLLAGVCAPGLLALSSLRLGVPSPAVLDWVPTSAGGLSGLGRVASVIEHGAPLAIAWLFGALAAEMFTKRSYSEGYATAFAMTARAGAAAVGVLALISQASQSLEIAQAGLVLPVLMEVGGAAGGPAGSGAADLIIIRSTNALFFDCAVCATVLTSWRMYRVSLFKRFND